MPPLRPSTPPTATATWTTARCSVGWSCRRSWPMRPPSRRSGTRQGPSWPPAPPPAATRPAPTTSCIRRRHGWPARPAPTWSRSPAPTWPTSPNRWRWPSACARCCETTAELRTRRGINRPSRGHGRRSRPPTRVNHKPGQRSETRSKWCTRRWPDAPGPGRACGHRLRGPAGTAARRAPRDAALDLGAERLKDLGGVAVGLDVVPGPLDTALFVDQKGGAQHPNAGLAIPGLLPPGAVGVHDLVVGVGQQWELEAVLVAEALVALGVVAGDADDRHAGGLEVGQVVVELARFAGAARGIVGGIEVEDDPLALEVGQRHGGAVLVGQGELRRLGAGLKLGHGVPHYDG